MGILQLVLIPEPIILVALLHMTHSYCELHTSGLGVLALKLTGA